MITERYENSAKSSKCSSSNSGVFLLNVGWISSRIQRNGCMCMCGV